MAIDREDARLNRRIEQQGQAMELERREIMAAVERAVRLHRWVVGLVIVNVAANATDLVMWLTH